VEFVHLYRVQKNPEGSWFDSKPILYFSKEVDIYLQSLQTIRVEEAE
jgi:hypothetical protein